MVCIIAGRRMGGNGDGSVTARHLDVARRADRSPSPVQPGRPAGDDEMPARKEDLMIRRLAAIATAATFVLTLSVSSVSAGGPPSLAFYVDGTRYRTVGTPTDFSHTGAPAASYDRIYVLGSGLANVAEAKPGDRDYNGGRWMVLPVTWAAGVTPVQLMSAEDVEAYADAGMLTIASSPVKLFECPVIPVGGR
jgi:hypothetical protein